MSYTRILPVKGTYAELDLSGPATQLDTVIMAANEGPDGNLVTIAAVADSGLGEGVTFDVTDTAIVCHFEDGVSTVADFEEALEADSAVTALISIKTAGTQAAVLAVTDDDFAATALAGGGATSASAPTIDDADAGVPLPYLCDSLTVLVREAAGSGTMTATVTLYAFHPEMRRWFLIKALNGGVAIPESASNAIAYYEVVTGLYSFTRVAAVLSVAGTGTEVQVGCIPVPQAFAKA